MLFFELDAIARFFDAVVRLYERGGQISGRQGRVGVPAFLPRTLFAAHTLNKSTHAQVCTHIIYAEDTKRESVVKTSVRRESGGHGDRFAAENAQVCTHIIYAEGTKRDSVVKTSVGECTRRESGGHGVRLATENPWSKRSVGVHPSRIPVDTDRLAACVLCGGHNF